jgi:branched-chain amino acid transport system substrate-binding protein
MAAQEINSNGGIDGRPVQIIYEDSQTNPAKGVSSFQKLISIDKVDVVMSDVWAFLSNPLVPLSESNKIITISPTVMDNSVEGTSTYFFTMGHTTSSIKSAIEKFFDVNPSAKTVGIICVNANTWGRAFTKAYEDVIKERGKEIVVKSCSNDNNVIDYRLEAAKIKEAKPDLVLVNGWGDRAVKSMRDFGITSPIIVDSNLVDGFENSGSVSLEQLKNVFVIDWRPNQEFALNYKKKYGKYPVLEAQNSYELVRSIAKAYKNNPTNLLDGLKKVKYESVDGNVDFTSGTNVNPNKSEAGLYIILGKGDYEKVK